MGCFDSGGSKSTSTSYTPEQRRGLTQALDVYLQQLGKGERIYPGETVAGLSSTQKAALGTAGQYVGAGTFAPTTTSPVTQAAEKAASSILTGEVGPKPLSAEKAAGVFRRIGEEPQWREFQERTAPLIREEYAGPGYWSSARAGAVGRAGEELTEEIGRQREEFLWGVEQYNRELENQQVQNLISALGVAPSISQLQTQDALAKLAGLAAISELSGQEQAVAQARINADIDKFRAEGRITSEEDMAIILALLDMNYTTKESSKWGAGLGYVGAGAALKTLGGMAGQAAGSALGF